MTKIVHIINPFKVPKESDLYIAQPITFESMRIAKEIAETQDEHLKIELLACYYPEDEAVVPSFFKPTANLKRSVKDIPRFKNNKKLPFIGDILQKAYEISDADYVVFSNVDIGLYQDFYIMVKSLLEGGYDGICINRNTLTDGDYSPSDLSKLYSLQGRPHEGIDCFVFKRHLIPQFILVDSIVGSGPVGLIIALNLVNSCEKFLWIREGKYTFHIGDDKAWLGEKMDKNSLLYYNNDQLFHIVKKLLEFCNIKHKELLYLTVRNHILNYLHSSNLLSRPYHRDALGYFSDGDFESVRELLKEQINEISNIGKP